MSKKKAAALTAAKQNELHYEAYPKAAPLSSTKMQVGELLLYLQISPETNRKVYWQQFEVTLREYINLKLNEV